MLNLWQEIIPSHTHTLYQKLNVRAQFWRSHCKPTCTSTYYQHVGGNSMKPHCLINKGTKHQQFYSMFNYLLQKKVAYRYSMQTFWKNWKEGKQISVWRKKEEGKRSRSKQSILTGPSQAVNPRVVKPTKEATLGVESYRSKRAHGGESTGLLVSGFQLARLI